MALHDLGFGDSQFTKDDERVGSFFNNPDYVSDYHAPGWGYVVTADELRYEEIYGISLLSTELSQTITNNTLLEYVTKAIGVFERDLGIHILPHMNLFKPPRNPNTGAVPVRTDIPQEMLDYIARMTPKQKADLVLEGIGTNYKYDQQNADNYLFIKLDHRPLHKLLSAKLIDPLYNQLVALLPMAREKLGLDASIQFYPSTQFLQSQPFLMMGNKFQITYPYDNFPDAFLLDYISGYPNAMNVPEDLKQALLWFSSISLMHSFGDGRSAAIASASASMNGISESYTTPMSASFELFGARMNKYQEELKRWYANNKYKYSHAMLGSL